MADMKIKVAVDTSELDTICQVKCFNVNCIHHNRDGESATCDKKNIVIDDNGNCIHSREATSKRRERIKEMLAIVREIEETSKKGSKIPY